MNVVAIAACAGRLKAVSEVLSALPPDFLAAITMVPHLSPCYRSYRDEILNSRFFSMPKNAIRAGCVDFVLSSQNSKFNETTKGC